MERIASPNCRGPSGVSDMPYGRYFPILGHSCERQRGCGMLSRYLHPAPSLLECIDGRQVSSGPRYGKYQWGEASYALPPLVPVRQRQIVTLQPLRSCCSPKGHGCCKRRRR